MTHRRGTTVLEILVALPLVLLIGALAVQVFTTQLRVVHVHESRLANQRELEHAALVLAADVRPLGARDLESWSDSAVVAFVPVLMGYVCGAPAANMIDVAVGNTGTASRTVQVADPRSADRVRWSAPDTSTVGVPSVQLDTVAHQVAVLSVARVPAACADSPLRGAASPWRITLEAPAATLPELGALLTVHRRSEWRLYRAGDGANYLGRREWNGMAWSVIQPAAGPLGAAAMGGLVLRVLREDGGLADPALHDARLLQLELRARRAASTVHDSLFVRLALRGGH